MKGVKDEELENEKELNRQIEIVMGKIGVELDNAADIEDIKRIGKYTKDRTKPI